MTEEEREEVAALITNLCNDTVKAVEQAHTAAQAALRRLAGAADGSGLRTRPIATQSLAEGGPDMFIARLVHEELERQVQAVDSAILAATREALSGGAQHGVRVISYGDGWEVELSADVPFMTIQHERKQRTANRGERDNDKLDT